MKERDIKMKRCVVTLIWISILLSSCVNKYRGNQIMVEADQYEENSTLGFEPVAQEECAFSSNQWENEPEFPRIGIWWFDVAQTTPSDIARYDLLLNEFEGEGLLKKLNQGKEINPKIKVFRPISPSERSLFWEWEGKKYPNPEIKDLPSDFFLLQVGSKLTKELNISDQEVYVSELYYKNGVPKFHVGGEVAIGQYESARIIEIDEDANKLTVERGYARAATPHIEGEMVASHIRFWYGTWVMNNTSACPLLEVKGVKGPVNWISYFFKLTRNDCEGIYDDPSSNFNYIDQENVKYDGIIIDRFEDYESWLVWTEDGQVEIDLYHQGIASNLDEFDAAWQEGVDELLSMYNQEFPGLPVIRNNPNTLRLDIFEGQVFETGGWSEPTTEWWETLIIKPDMKSDYPSLSYSNWFMEDGAPNTVLLEVYEDEKGPDSEGDGQYDNPFDEPNFKPDYKKMRFSLTSALLGDGYYSYEMNTNGHGYLGLMWFDEYDNGGLEKGYLGYPVGPYQKNNQGVYYREFENGLVLVNPQEYTIETQLKQPYQKIKGTQVPQINDGKIVETIELDPFDGIILLKP